MRIRFNFTDAGRCQNLFTLIRYFALSAMLICPAGAQVQAAQSNTNFISVSKDGKHFALSGSGDWFHPWGFNYDRDANGRLLEDYWTQEWSTVSMHFEQMKALGANTVRIHLQLARFMESADQPNAQTLAQLGRLLLLAQTNRLYLDLTGLCCFRREDVPAWYNAMDEKHRWQVQARFWEAVATTCAKSPAVFCYDLMNEPLVTDECTNREWLEGELGGKWYMQRLTLDFAGRTEKQIAAAWVRQMAAAVHRHDRRHLVTVGAVPWGIQFPGAKPIFYSKEASKDLDFVSVHFYPEAGKVKNALTVLADFNIGKPVVIEETYPIACSIEEENQFLDGSRAVATGWISFYWGEPAEQFRREQENAHKDPSRNWLEFFVQKGPEFKSRMPVR